VSQQQRRFLDRILQFMGIQEEQVAEEPEKPLPEPIEPLPRSSRVLRVAETGAVGQPPGPNRAAGSFASR